MDEGGKYFYFTFISNDEAAKAEKPADRSFDFPATTVTPELPTILLLRFTAIAAMWTNEIDPSMPEPITKRIAVARLVVNQPVGILSRPTSSTARHGDLLERRFDQRRLVGRCGFDLNSERYTLAIRHHHKLCTLSAFGLSDAGAPFFAGENVPSAKHSSHWILSSSSSMQSNARHAASNEPSCSHVSSRRQHVLAEGKCRGKSFHRAPLRRSHNAPSKQGRFGTGFGPPRLDAFGVESNGSITPHCVSVNSNPTSYSRLATNTPPCVGVFKHKPLHGASLIYYLSQGVMKPVLVNLP